MHTIAYYLIILYPIVMADDHQFTNSGWFSGWTWDLHAIVVFTRAILHFPTFFSSKCRGLVIHSRLDVAQKKVACSENMVPDSTLLSWWKKIWTNTATSHNWAVLKTPVGRWFYKVLLSNILGIIPIHFGKSYEPAKKKPSYPMNSHSILMFVGKTPSIFRHTLSHYSVIKSLFSMVKP